MATSKDAKAICEIYNHYVLHTHSTFETEEVGVLEMAERIERVTQEFKLPWLVLESGSTMAGYAYATQWKPRQAYARTTESTVYLHFNEFGKGYGTQLYGELIKMLKEAGHHAIIGGIALPNEGSIALHEKLGFKKIGQFEEVGFKLGRWVDVGYWEIVF